LSIKVISVSKVYPNATGSVSSVYAIKNLNIDINEGSYTFISGPTGSGKTTLLSLLVGIIYPSQGEIIFGDTHFPSDSDEKVSLFREKYIGYIPQNTFLINECSVLENVLSPNLFLNRRIKQLKSSALILLEKLGLLNKKNANPTQLSGGEMKKVTIARALIKKPLYVIADEPFSELDNESMNVVINLMIEEHKNGAAIIFASHDPFTFGTNADIYTLSKGQITEYRREVNDEPSELRMQA